MAIAKVYWTGCSSIFLFDVTSVNCKTLWKRFVAVVSVLAPYEYVSEVSQQITFQKVAYYTSGNTLYYTPSMPPSGVERLCILVPSYP